VQLLIYIQATDHPSNAAAGSSVLVATINYGGSSSSSVMTFVNMLGNTTDYITVTVATCQCTVVISSSSSSINCEAPIRIRTQALYVKYGALKTTGVKLFAGIIILVV